MGGRSWIPDEYESSAKGRDAFKYSAETLNKPLDQRKIHQLLDPFGLRVRESRDSEEHPNSNAIAIGLDVTGSMTRVVYEIQLALGRLMGMLLDNKLVVDPQILCFAIGDATCDNFPFQISQFESDIRINDQLTKFILEGGGGSYITESYEHGYYAMSRHTALDCLERRNEKGTLFTIGDELPYDVVSNTEIKRVFNAPLQGDISFTDIVTEVQKKFNTFHIIPKGSNNYGVEEIRRFWAKALGGDQFVLSPSPAAICETIALASALIKRTLTFEDGLEKIESLSGALIAKEVREVLTPFAKTIIADDKQKTINDQGNTAVKTNDKTGKSKKKKPGKLFQ
ncbi:MAG: hypothetical protein HY226_01210 [Candidatus Vogelbacteria bacterium]|nr:hypothetical protein [Candidatus Vogelbacteria bacterium]